MSTHDFSQARWRKSSRSNHNGDCVEVALSPNAVATRDSKNPTGPTLTFTPTEWTSFLNTLKAGAFNAPS